MSEYIHEKVLQEYIIENILELNITVKYKQVSHYKIVEAKFNTSGTFWDLNGKLENGVWIPIEIEWISKNFETHKHHLSKDLNKFIDENGILIVLRKNKEIHKIQQVSIFENLPETKFKSKFVKWFKGKAYDYAALTLDEFFIGNYQRNIPRVLLYPISKRARENYFSIEPLYRKNNLGPLILGFKESAYEKNVFVRDIKPNDICLFLDADGKRTKRTVFIDNIKNGSLAINSLTAFRITSSLYKKSKLPNTKVDDLYWNDEIELGSVIYPYICTLEDLPFFKIKDKTMPYIENFIEENWESLRSCIQYGEYKEMSSLDFTMLISNIK